MNFHLRRLTAACLTHEVQLIIFWLPSWANPADAPTRFYSLDAWRAKFPRAAPPWSEMVPLLQERLDAELKPEKVVERS